MNSPTQSPSFSNFNREDSFCFPITPAVKQKTVKKVWYGVEPNAAQSKTKSVFSPRSRETGTNRTSFTNRNSVTNYKNSLSGKTPKSNRHMTAQQRQAKIQQALEQIEQQPPKRLPKNEQNRTEVILHPEKGLILKPNQKPDPSLLGRRTSNQFFSKTAQHNRLKKLMSVRQSGLIDYRLLDDEAPDFLLPLEYTAADWNRVVHPRVSYETSQVGSGFRMRAQTSSAFLLSKPQQQSDHTKREKLYKVRQLKVYERQLNFKLDQEFEMSQEIPRDLGYMSKFQKFQVAQITGCDNKRFIAVQFIFEWMIKVEFHAKEGLFNDGLFAAYQILRVARLLGDFVNMLNFYSIFANFLMQADSFCYYKILQFMADLAQDTNHLNYLTDTYLRIGRYLTVQQEYDKAIRVFQKLLKIVWLENDTVTEVKVYEMLALQYFYKQDLEKCKMYLDRSLRGKVEGLNSSSKLVAMQQGFRSTDGIKHVKKKIYVGAKIERTNTIKSCDSIVRDYKKILKYIDKAKQGWEFRPPLKQMIAEMTKNPLGHRVIRPSTPFMDIPEHKLLTPSAATTDHMLLPSLSELDLHIMQLQKHRRSASIDFKTSQERAEHAKDSLSFNQARVQFNIQNLNGEYIDYLQEIKQAKEKATKPENQEIVWSEYVQKSMVNQTKAQKQKAFLSHLSQVTGPTKLSKHLCDPKTTPTPVRKSNTDFVKDEISMQSKKALAYLVSLKEMVYICETVHIDRVGLKVAKTFYVDKHGRDPADFLPI